MSATSNPNIDKSLGVGDHEIDLEVEYEDSDSANTILTGDSVFGEGSDDNSSRQGGSNVSTPKIVSNVGTPTGAYANGKMQEGGLVYGEIAACGNENNSGGLKESRVSEIGREEDEGFDVVDDYKPLGGFPNNNNNNSNSGSRSDNINYNDNDNDNGVSHINVDDGRGGGNGVSVVLIDDFVVDGSPGRVVQHSIDSDDGDAYAVENGDASDNGLSGSFYYKYNPNEIVMKSFLKNDADAIADALLDNSSDDTEENTFAELNRSDHDIHNKQQYSQQQLFVAASDETPNSDNSSARSRDSSFDVIEDEDLVGSGILRPPTVSVPATTKNSKSDSIDREISGSGQRTTANTVVNKRGGNRGEDSPVVVSSPGILGVDGEILSRSQIVYSSNGQEVSIRTRLGEIMFNSSEFSFYQAMFKIADLKNSGRLNNHNSHLPILLLRANLDGPRLEKILNLVNLKKQNSSGDEPLGLSLNQWLVLCKLIAFAQQPENANAEFNESTITQIADISRQNRTGNQNAMNICNFNLGKPMRLPSAQDQHYKVIIKGFRSFGNGYEQHIKFILVSKIFSVPSPIKSAISSGGGGFPMMESARTYSHSEVEVVRRYSDFELLVRILQKCNPGIILPALPPKSWWSENVESTAQKRCHLLQLFLSDITQHPMLRLSYELKAFLEASSTGFKSFREMYPKMIDPMDSSYSYSSSVAAIVGDNIIYGATKAYSLISGLIYKVAKTISWDTSEKIPCECSNEDFAKRVNKTISRYALVKSLGQNLELLNSQEQAITNEISGMAFDLKQASDMMNDTLLDPIVGIFSKFAENYASSQATYLEEQTKNVNINIQYLGSYHDSLVIKSSECSSFKELLSEANKRQLAVRSQLDSVRIATNLTSKEVASKCKALESDLLEAVRAFENVKSQDKVMFDNVSRELQHLESIKSKKLQDNSEEFVRGKIQNCKDNIEIWTSLLNSLNESKPWNPDISGVLDEKDDA